MTVASAPPAPSAARLQPRLAFMAALAAVSRGRALAQPQLQAFARALDAADAPAEVRAEVLIAGQAGLRAAQLAVEPGLGTNEAADLLAALVLFALRAADDPEQLLAAPEAVAAALRWPADAVPRLAGRLGPLAAGLPLDLDAQLAAFVDPGEAEREAGRWLAATLDPQPAPRRSFAHVPASAFQHPLDRQAMDLVSGVAGFEDLTRVIFEYGFERVFRLINLSSAIRVGPDQFPELYRIWQGCLQRAGCDPEMELYVKAGGLNAHTSGVERPYVMLDSGAVNALTRAELEYVLGHELGHVRCEHLLHLFLIQVLPFAASMVPVVGRLLAMGLDAALGEWQRKAELSCDRAGLLTCQDPEAAVSTMMKFSGAPGAFYQRLDQAAFLRQHDEFRDLDRDLLSLVYKVLMTLNRSHPWTVERAAELVRWQAEGGYDAVFAGAAPAVAPLLLPAPVAPPPTAEAAAARLAELAAAAESLGAGPGARALVEALATPVGAAPAIAIVGEKRRGKTTLVGRLAAELGAEAEVVDTPGLNDADAAFEDQVMAQVLRADAVMACLSAAQLLSNEERQLLRDRVLPLAPGRCALVVTHMDALQSDADHAELATRLARFVARSERTDLAIFHLAPGADAPLPAALVDWARGGAALARAEGRAAWRGRARSVLGALARACDDLPEDAGGWVAPDAEERAAVKAAIAREHELALDAASAHLAGRIAGLRQEVPARVAALTPAQLGREGLAAFTGEVQRAAREAADTYLRAFERGLQARAGLTDHAAERLRPEATDGLGRGAAVDGVRIDARRPRDVVTIGLTLAGVGVVIFGGGVAGLLVGGVAIAGAHALRLQSDAAFRARLQEDATAALDGWLAGAEAAVATGLRERAAAVRDALLERSEAVLDRPPPLGGDAPATTGGLREAIAATRAWLAGGA